MRARCAAAREIGIIEREVSERLARKFEESLIEDLIIRDKAGKLSPLALNGGQRLLLEAAQRQRDAGRPVRVVLLKARQFGGSTLAQALMYVDAYFRPERESWVVAHNLASARALGGISRRFHKNMAEWESRKARSDNKGELAFDNGSRLCVGTANDLRAGRGFTVHNLHASEVAYWGNAPETMLSLLQAVPDHEDTMVIVESTANGAQGWFHDLWRGAKAGRNGFEPVFVGWNMIDEYSVPFRDNERREGFAPTLSEEERELAMARGLTFEQLNWRRMCVSDKCGGREDVFRQEYPLFDQEAFLTSGRPVFAAAGLDRQYAEAEAPAERGEVADGQIRPASGGRLKVWRRPEQGEMYVIGVDVSEGIEVLAGRDRFDNSCVQVLRREGLEQVACWAGKIDPDALADVVMFLGEYYNNAFTGVEANNHGLTTLTALKGRYQYLYRREIFDERSRRRTEKLGWLTTVRTRPLMIDCLARAIREGELVVRDEETLSELLTFSYDKNGRACAQEGCRDDRVFALAVALQMYEFGPVSGPAAAGVATPLEERLDVLRSLREGKRGASRDGWNVV